MCFWLREATKKPYEGNASDGVGKDRTTGGVVPSFSWKASCFSPYISNRGRARSGSHDQDDISPQSIGESPCQHDDKSIDRLVRWQLWALVEESGEDLGVV
jgi:hypothetical protein